MSSFKERSRALSEATITPIKKSRFITALHGKDNEGDTQLTHSSATQTPKANPSVQDAAANTTAGSVITPSGHSHTRHPFSMSIMSYASLKSPSGPNHPQEEPDVPFMSIKPEEGENEFEHEREPQLEQQLSARRMTSESHGGLSTKPKDPTQEAAKVGKFIVGDKLGEGSYSIVKRCMHEETKQQYALKVVSKDRLPTANLEKQVRKEVKIMQYLRHPNVVTVHDVLMSERNMYIVMELVKGRELFQELTFRGKFEESVARRIFQQIVDAVAYCHQKGVFHRDLKPENVLIDDDYNVKVTDFGMGWIQEEQLHPTDPKNAEQQLMHTQVGTPQYMAPELLQPSAQGYRGDKVDIWALGMILYVLLSGTALYPGDDIEAVKTQVFSKRRMRFHPSIPKEAKDLIEKMIVKEPEQRMSLATVREHPWFVVNYKPIIPEQQLQQQQVQQTQPQFISSGILNSDQRTPSGGRTNSGSRDREHRGITRKVSDTDTISGIFKRMPSKGRSKSRGPDVALLNRKRSSRTLLTRLDFSQESEGAASLDDPRYRVEEHGQPLRTISAIDMTLDSGHTTLKDSAPVKEVVNVAKSPRGADAGRSPGEKSYVGQLGLEIPAGDESTVALRSPRTGRPVALSACLEQVVKSGDNTGEASKESSGEVLPSPRRFTFGRSNLSRKSRAARGLSTHLSSNLVADLALGLQLEHSSSSKKSEDERSRPRHPNDDDPEEIYVSEEAFERVKSFFVKDTHRLMEEIMNTRQLSRNRSRGQNTPPERGDGPIGSMRASALDETGKDGSDASSATSSGRPSRRLVSFAGRVEEEHNLQPSQIKSLRAEEAARPLYRIQPPSKTVNVNKMATVLESKLRISSKVATPNAEHGEMSPMDATRPDSRAVSVRSAPGSRYNSTFVESLAVGPRSAIGDDSKVNPDIMLDKFSSGLSEMDSRNSNGPDAPLHASVAPDAVLRHAAAQPVRYERSPSGRGSSQSEKLAPRQLSNQEKMLDLKNILSDNR